MNEKTEVKVKGKKKNYDEIYKKIVFTINGTYWASEDKLEMYEN